MKMRLCPQRCGWSVVLFVLFASTYIACPAQQHGPAVFGLAMGVETTEGLSARGASKDVVSFCGALLATYNDASLKQLRNTAATREAFDKWLREARSLDAESVIVVYFSGHGVRTKDENRSLRFLLSGANANDPDPSLDVSFSLRELVSALSEIKRATVMVFLDCCYSGLTANDKEFFEVAFKSQFDCRAFVLSSVADNEEGFGTVDGGYFTQSILEVMKSNSPAGCLTAENLYLGVDDLIVNKKKLKGIHPYFATSGNMDRCLARLGDPYFNVVVSFDRPPEGVLDMVVDDTINHRFRCSPEERTFRSSLPKGTHSLKISSNKYEDNEVSLNGDNAKQGLLRTNISLKLKFGYREAPTTLSSHMVDSILETAERSVAMQLPSALTASIYTEAAFALVKNKISDDSSGLLKMAKRFDSANTFLRLACASKQEANAMARNLSVSEITSEDIRHSLELAGRYDIAAEVNSVLLSKLDDQSKFIAANSEKERIAREQATIAARIVANVVAIKGETIKIGGQYRLTTEEKSNLERFNHIIGVSEAARIERRDKARDVIFDKAFCSPGERIKF